MPPRFGFEPVGVVESCFKEKFGIPRQPGLAAEARATIRLPLARFGDATGGFTDGLLEFSHIWVVFVFHENLGAGWKPRVWPPRLGGARKTGVFASRSPHRPNPIGISAVKLDRIERVSRHATSGGAILLHVSGVDLLDGTPVLDIKPYLPYADSIPRARAGWAGTRSENAEKRLRVSFSRDAGSRLRSVDPRGARKLRPLIAQLIAQDPRPAFQREKKQLGTYAFRLAEFDVHWAVNGRNAKVLELRAVELTHCGISCRAGCPSVWSPGRGE